MKKILLSLLASVLVAGCSGGAAEAPATLNATCPMMEGAVDPAEATSEWSGHRIGFCCDECKPKFDALSDAEKRAALQRVGAKVD